MQAVVFWIQMGDLDKMHICKTNYKNGRHVVGQRPVYFEEFPSGISLLHFLIIVWYQTFDDLSLIKYRLAHISTSYHRLILHKGTQID